MKNGVRLRSWTGLLALSLAWVTCRASSGRDGEKLFVLDASNVSRTFPREAQRLSQAACKLWVWHLHGADHIYFGYDTAPHTLTQLGACGAYYSREMTNLVEG